MNIDRREMMAGAAFVAAPVTASLITADCIVPRSTRGARMAWIVLCATQVHSNVWPPMLDAYRAQQENLGRRMIQVHATASISPLGHVLVLFEEDHPDVSSAVRVLVRLLESNQDSDYGDAVYAAAALADGEAIDVMRWLERCADGDEIEMRRRIARLERDLGVLRLHFEGPSADGNLVPA